MGEHSSENYLDQLLNSMGLDEPAEKKIERPVTPQEQLERDLFGEPVTKEKAKAKDPSYEGIPQNLVNAFVAIEDKRFFEHQGVDWKRTFAAFANMFLHFYSSNIRFSL